MSPFCFRCGGEPKYQLELRTKAQAGPFWVLCAKCALGIPWESILRETIKDIEAKAVSDDLGTFGL